MRKHVFLATPSKEGKVTVPYLQAYIDLVTILLRNKTAVTRGFIVNNSLIHDARNRLTMDFLESPASDMLFIDDDLGFDAFGAYRLLRAKEDVIGGAYPQKKEGLIFNVGLMAGGQHRGRIFEVDYIGAGMLKISRAAVLKMMEHFPEDKYTYPDGRKMHNFFKMEGGKLGEDVSFMRRWRSIGGQVWCDPDISFVHTGTKDYAGKFADILNRAPK